MRLVLIFCFFSLSHLDGESNLGPKTFEELCRAHIEAFAKGAQEYALSSQLTDRVNLWQERLAPILEEEERRAEFDIHAYASRVIQLAQEELVRKEDDMDTVSCYYCKMVFWRFNILLLIYSDLVAPFNMTIDFEVELPGRF